MNTKDGYIKIGNSKIKCKIPITCPYCSAYIQPHQKSLASVPYNQDNKIHLVTFSAICCNKLFFAIYETSKQAGELLASYPAEKPIPLSEAINEISPRFIELYNQAFFAEQQNFFELAGSGYRNALEVLIKDFAIDELGEPSQEVCKQNLYDAIGKYLPSIKLSTAADVVRVLGNDFTHYERKYKDVDLDVLKRYLHIFINAIENEYLLQHPVVNTNRK